MANAKRLMVQILSPTNMIYAGSAIAVTSFNDKGRFDVLPLHANFVSIIKKAVIIKSDKKNQRKIELEEGVLHCRNDQVRIFIGISLAAEGS